MPDKPNDQKPTSSKAVIKMRSFLFVSHLDVKALEQASASAADCFILDLVGRDQESLEQLPALLNCFTGVSRHTLFAQVNHPHTGQTETDLSYVMPLRPSGIVLPRVVGYADVARLAAMLAVAEAEHGLEHGSTRILAIAGDTSAGIMALSSFASAEGPARRRLVGLAWDSQALLAEMGAIGSNHPSNDTSSLARSMTLMAARATRVQAIDSCCHDADFLEQDCREGAAIGFDGKLAIEPSQADSINKIFSVVD